MVTCDRDPEFSFKEMAESVATRHFLDVAKNFPRMHRRGEVLPKFSSHSSHAILIRLSGPRESPRP